MTTRRLFEAMEIFKEYNADTEVCAEHDEIFACGTPPGDMSKMHVKALKALGWSWDKSLTSWQAFT